jgi:arylsulfatase A-like enzyme
MFRLLIILVSTICFLSFRSERPEIPLNILWLSVEDMSPHLGCYGDFTVPTPNIDRLAKEGIRYTKAYCTAGVCAPSRNAIITGRWQTSNGGHNMRTLFDTYPQITQLPKSYSSVPPAEVRAFPEYLRAKGYYCTNNEKTDYQFEHNPLVWDESSNKAHYQNRTTKQPFFAIFNHVGTHESQVWVKKDKPLRVDPAKIKVPPYYPDNALTRQDMARFFTNISEMDDWVGEKIAELEKNGLLDNTIIFFWSDHGDGLPYVKRELYDRGLMVPLIVRFPDKRMAGTNNDRLISMIDLAPTVLSLVDISTPKQMYGKAFLGKHATPKGHDYIFAARDRMDSEYDRVRAVSDGRYKYIYNFEPQKPAYQNIQFRLQQPMMAEIIRLRDAGQLTGDAARWFAPEKPQEELYDTQNDPQEFSNLVADPKYKQVLGRLRKVMQDWQKNVPDYGAIPEKELVKQWWNGKNAPPVTAKPSLSIQNGRASLSCETPGASIGYKIYPGDGSAPERWEIYQGPFEVPRGAKVSARAWRIGYTGSTVATD